MEFHSSQACKCTILLRENAGAHLLQYAETQTDTTTIINFSFISQYFIVACVCTFLLSVDQYETVNRFVCYSFVSVNTLSFITLLSLVRSLKLTACNWPNLSAVKTNTHRINERHAIFVLSQNYFLSTIFQVFRKSSYTSALQRP